MNTGYVRTNLSYGFDTLVYRFYKEGKLKREKSVPIDKLDEYEESLAKNGWERLYTEQEINRVEEEIEKLEKLKALLKYMKQNEFKKENDYE